MGCSSRRLVGQRHAENLRGNRENVVDDPNSRRGWKRVYREVGQGRQVDTEKTKERVWTVVICDHRMGHSRRKTKRYWKGAREEPKMGGRDVTVSLGPEDRRRMAAARVATVEVESRMAVDHRLAYPMGLCVRAGM